MPLKFSDIRCVFIFNLQRACYVCRPLHLPSLDHLNNISIYEAPYCEIFFIWVLSLNPLPDVMFSTAHCSQIIFVPPLGCEIVFCPTKIPNLFVLCFTNKPEHHGWVLGTSASYTDGPNVEFSYHIPDVFSEDFCASSHSSKTNVGMLRHKSLSLATPLPLNVMRIMDLKMVYKITPKLFMFMEK